jgi:hypothetical protein
MRKIFFTALITTAILSPPAWSQAPDTSSPSPQDCEKNGFKDCVYGLKWGAPVDKDFLEKEYCPKATGSDILDFRQNKQKGNMYAQFGRWQSGQPACQVGETFSKTRTDKYRYVGTNADETLPPLFFLLKTFLSYQNTELVSRIYSVASHREVDENYVLHLSFYPLVIGKITRSLLVFPNQLVGYATSSEVATGIDPKIYFFEAKKKYGEPMKVLIDDPGAAPYSHIGMWAEDDKKLLVGINFQLDLKKIEEVRRGRRDGAVIYNLVPGLPGEKAGFKPGDVIISANNAPIGDAAAFVALVKKQIPDSILNVKIIRGDREFILKTKLASSPYYRENPSPLIRFVMIQPRDPDDRNSQAYVRTLLLHKGFPAVWEAFVKRGSEMVQAQQNKEHEEKTKELNNVDL